MMGMISAVGLGTVASVVVVEVVIVLVIVVRVTMDVSSMADMMMIVLAVEGTVTVVVVVMVVVEVLGSMLLHYVYRMFKSYFLASMRLNSSNRRLYLHLIHIK
jgi:hypothetical protein